MTSVLARLPIWNSSSDGEHAPSASVFYFLHAFLPFPATLHAHSAFSWEVRGKPLVWVDSLEAPLGTRQGCLADRLIVPVPEPQQQPADFATLYQAISALTPKQRYVVLRFFGLDGDAPESIAAISRRLSTTNPKVTIARNRYNMAIRSLRRKLLQ